MGRKRAVTIVKWVLLSVLVTVLTVCLYLWGCMIAAKITGTVPQIGGIQIVVASYDVSPHLSKGILVGLVKNEDGVDRGDIVLIHTDKGDSLGEVVAVDGQGVFVYPAKDQLPVEVPSEQIQGVALFTNGVLGGVLLFLSTPAGAAMTIFIPMIALFCGQIYVVQRRRKTREQAKKIG